MLDHAQKDVLAQVLQIACRDALTIEPTDDQGTIEVRQVFPGILFAVLSAEEQTLPSLVHGTIFPSPSRANGGLAVIFRTTRVRFSAASRFLYSSPISDCGQQEKRPARQRRQETRLRPDSDRVPDLSPGSLFCDCTGDHRALKGDIHDGPFHCRKSRSCSRFLTLVWRRHCSIPKIGPPLPPRGRSSPAGQAPSASRAPPQP